MSKTEWLPVVLAVDDGRYRPKNWNPGESGLYDHEQQKIHLRNAGVPHNVKAHGVKVDDLDESIRRSAPAGRQGTFTTAAIIQPSTTSRSPLSPVLWGWP